jgi:hypothetical protein
MSPGQLRRYALDDIKRLDDGASLPDWLPDVVPDLSRVKVGVWRCVSGEVLCPEGECGGCDCCENDELIESPLTEGWHVECLACNRPMVLVEVIDGEHDFSYIARAA